MSTILPGAGWSGATPTPSAQGTPGAAGYTACAHARWNVIPFQEFTTTFNAGVVADYREGISRVEFSVNNGPWFPVSAPSINPTTGVEEYWATLTAADYPDGAVPEIRAIVYPKVGLCRVLGGPDIVNGNGEHSMFLTANAGNTLLHPARYVAKNGSDTNDGLTPATAFATPNKAAHSMTEAHGSSDGGNVFLLPGAWLLESAAWNTNSVTSNRWMTVRPAPGFTKADVSISGSQGAGFNSKLVKFEDVTFTAGVGSGGPMVDYIWLHDCKLQGPGRLLGSIIFGDWSGSFITDTKVLDVSTGVGAHLVRNVEITRIAGDAFSNSGMVINCTEIDQDRTGGGDIHADVYQNTSPSTLRNVILLNVKAHDRILNSAGVFQVEGSWLDYLVKGCHIIGQGDILIDAYHLGENQFFKNTIFSEVNIFGTHTPVNFVIEGCTFLNGVTPSYPGVTVRAGVTPTPTPTPTPVPEPTPDPTPVPPVGVAPVITVPPAFQVVRKKQNVSFTSVVEGTEPMAYKWTKNGTQYGTGLTLTLRNVNPSYSGIYKFTATNAFGSAETSVPLTVI